MSRITAETCRAFTLQEILILAAMNVETIPGICRLDRHKTAGTKRVCLSARHFVRLRIRKTLQA